ncbi:helix-turn-helix domain-containing protein [Vibrio parahaemolyticus]|uniref:XRE family transcriptional regulator n=2 Tax=Vibrio TaxID=662 RepID=A0A249WA84_VIBPH|nr:helix-turn-helix transcriptional regulator [Vibrio parahaemolyticus]MBY8001460.1 helix-turn-helix domain-containing protein [Vibrio fluvialis]ASZ53454.1 XRE family transcriptional regulator [Vibrio parahaemolyticus]AUT85645.1 XRE family transcriptional regulator [Vibrio parahaemolyticus]EGF42604.1 putative transcriptional regulator [Vibrio parahaemolyticus 10329]EGQ7710288.1 helix-turn-helix transcriptional regulator [Vibrio parahaemolyticus]
MKNQNAKAKRTAVIFPKTQAVLSTLGENITLAMKRRGITQDMMHNRTGISKPTLRKITKGDPSVSLGHYVNVLSVLGLLDDIAKVAFDDELGRKLQDIELLKKKR